MRKILIATPVKGGLSMEYVAQLLSIIHSQLPDTFIDWLPCGGTSVALARNELAFLAIQKGFDDLVFWDKDLGERTPQLQLSLFCRIISHPEPIVAAQYCGHGLPSAFHGCKFDAQSAPNDAGLLRMHQMPLGFCKISIEAFKTIRRNTPERAYWGRELTTEAEHRHEFFPTGIVGPNTAEGKLERIKQQFSSWINTQCRIESDDKLLIDRIDEIIGDTDYSLNTMYGEDFMFCKLARDAGIPLYIDTRVIIPHESGLRLPLPVDDMKRELAASWRMPETPNAKQPFSIIKQGEPLWPSDYISPLLAPDHCAEVLAGSYDIDFNPASPPVILDVGANVGAFARWAAQRWPGCTLYCYEPEPSNIRLLLRTWSTIPDIIGHVSTMAVSDKTGNFDLKFNGFNCGEFSLLGSAEDSKKTISVAVIRAALLPTADILKIDTEGAELPILQCLDKAGRLHEFKAIMLEFHAEPHIAPICALLTEAGFKEAGRNITSQHRGELKFLKA